MDKEEFRKTIWACRDYIRLNKVQWEFRFAWNVKGNRNSFYCFKSNGRLNRDERLCRDNTSLLLTWADDLVVAEMDAAEDSIPPL